MAGGRITPVGSLAHGTGRGASPFAAGSRGEVRSRGRVVAFTGTPTKTRLTLEGARAAGITDLWLIPPHKNAPGHYVTADGARAIANEVLAGSGLHFAVLAHGLDEQTALFDDIRAQVGSPLDGVYSAYDLRTRETADLARELQLAGLLSGSARIATVPGVTFAKSKWRTRVLANRVARESVGSAVEMREIWAEFLETTDLSLAALRARTAASGVTLPSAIVILPDTAAGSLGATYIDLTQPDAEAQIDAARESILGHSTSHYIAQAGNLREVVVSEYVDGPEYTLDCVTVDGKVIPLAVTVKPDINVGRGHQRAGTTDEGMQQGQCFLEGMKLVIPPSSAAYQRLAKAVEMVHAHIAAEIGDGLHHVEFRIDAQHRPFLIEWNFGRGAGGKIPQAVHHATGIDLFAAQAAAAIGELPLRGEQLFEYAAALTLYPPRVLGLYMGMDIRTSQGVYARDVTPEAAEAAINAYLRNVKRSYVYDHFLRRHMDAAALSADERARIAANFDQTGSGLRATLEGVEFWLKRNTPITDPTDFVGAAIVTLGGEMSQEDRASAVGEIEILAGLLVIQPMIQASVMPLDRDDSAVRALPDGLEG